MNAHPFWWRYYIPYEDLKKSITILHFLRFTDFPTIATSRSPSSVYALNLVPNPPPDDESSDDEAPPSRHSSSTIGSPSPDNSNSEEDTSLLHQPNPEFRRSASQRVLAALNQPGATDVDEAEESDDAIPEFPTVVSPADAAEKFQKEEERFMRRLRLRTDRAQVFYARLCDELVKTSKALHDKVAWMRDVRRTVDEVAPLVLPPDPSGDLVSENDFRNFKRDCISHYREITEAINFSFLNKTAYRKILKKHDKRTGLNTLDSMMEQLNHHSKLVNTAPLEGLADDLEALFAELYTNGNTNAAKEELTQDSRDLVLYERTSLWQKNVPNMTITPRAIRGFESYREQQEQPVKLAIKWHVCAIAIFAYLFILCFPNLLRTIVGEDSVAHYSELRFEAANRCFALTILAVILWAAVGIPLYTTSFVVLSVCVLGHVFVDDNGVSLNPTQASSHVFTQLGSPTLLLILSVYALAAALSKFDIDRQVATTVLETWGRRADLVLAKLMFLSVFVSSLVSNVAAPVLLNSVLKPTFEIMDRNKVPRKYIQCLLLGIMVASNIGGFISTIASPQSAVAVGLLEESGHGINGLLWLVISGPICAVMACAFYAVLIIQFRPGDLTLQTMQTSRVQYKWWHYGIIATLAITTIIWLVPLFLNFFGTTGMEATIPLIVLFSLGILTKGDFNSLPWDVVILVAGGTVLGSAVQSSHLLNLLSHRLSALSGGGAWWTFGVLCTVVAILASFVSHTVSALILLPLFLQIGTQLEQSRVFVLGGTIAASCAMATNISSFPNISAAEVQDISKSTYLDSGHIGRIGSIMTLVALVILVVFGYPWMNLILNFA